MQRHTITYLCFLLCTLWLLPFMPSNKALASETPPAITPTPAPTDVISYELICTETRPLGCPEDTSNLSISWLVECGGACAPKRECSYVRHVNGTPAPISTLSPTPESTPTPTPDAPVYTNCGQSITLPEWQAGAINFCGVLPIRRHPSGGFTNCVGDQSGYRMAGINVSLTFGQDNLQDISNFDMSWIGDQNVQGSVIFHRCNLAGSCSTVNRTVSWGIGQFPPAFPSVDRVWRITINIGAKNLGGAGAVTVEQATDYFILNDVSFCASDAIFPPEATPTPTPSPTPEPQQPDCTTDVERLFRVASVPSCDVDDDLTGDWFGHDGDDIELELKEIPGNSNCYTHVLAYEEDYFSGDRLTIATDLDSYVWVSKIVIDVDARYSYIDNLEWDGMMIHLYDDRELKYEYSFNHDGDHPNEYTIPIPNVHANGIGVSIPVAPGEYAGIELYHLEAYGSLDLPICGAGGVAPNDCQDPRLMETGYDVPSLEMKKTGRRCFTVLPKFMSFKGLQACFDLYQLPVINLLGFSVPISMIFHTILAGYVLRNILTR